MSADHGLAADLGTLDRQTALLLDTALSVAHTSAPSLCEGWTRGHILTHVARNAEAIGRLADWALTGTRGEMYPGGAAARDAAIEAGAGRSLEALHSDVAETAARLTPHLRALEGDLVTDEVEMRGGLLVTARQLPFIRLREVVYHHVDLDAGFTFDDVEDALLVRFIDDAVSRLKLGHHPPDLRLHADEGETWEVGGAAAYVSGTRAGLLLWLARRIPSGVRSEGPLPALPRGA